MEQCCPLVVEFNITSEVCSLWNFVLGSLTGRRQSTIVTMHMFKIQPLVALARNGFAGHFRRNFGISAVVVQKATDPIQKLFVDKVKEYAQKSKGASGKLVDASAEILKAQKEDLERIEKQFGAGPGVDLLSFPQLSFKDPAIDPIDLEAKK